MSDKRTDVDESLEEGYTHDKPGRTPNPAEQDFGTTRSLEEAYSSKGSLYNLGKKMDDVLTDRRILTASGLAGGGGFLDVMYGPLNVPVVMNYPDAVYGVATAGAAVVGYNAVSYALEEFSDHIPEGSEPGFDDVEEEFSGILEEVEEEVLEAERRVEQEEQGFSPEEAVVLDEQKVEELSEMPGRFE